jgi:hypothetical protein
MFPASTIASPIFAAVWSLVSLGAMRASPTALLPFKDVWVRHARQALPVVEQLRDMLRAQCAFHANVAEMLLDDWRARDTRQFERDETDLDVFVGIACSENASDVPLDDRERRRRVESATRRQLVLLLDGVLVSAYVGEREGRNVHREAPRNVLWKARELVAEPVPFDGASAGSFLSHVADEWRRVPLDAGRQASLRHWMTERMALLS